ncbi:MAG: hypothetical protein IKX33_04345 [Prevotella sp.]|nr:hypothetical protein [Prevotella sp.]
MVSVANVFDKPNEQSQACLSYAMARTDGTASAETCLYSLCRVVREED